MCSGGGGETQDGGDPPPTIAGRKRARGNTGAAGGGRARKRKRKAEMSLEELAEHKERQPSYYCREEGCFKGPRWGMEGGRKKWCAEHAKDGTVDLQKGKSRKEMSLEELAEHKERQPSQYCREDGCFKAPTRGEAGGRKQWCVEHAREGTVDLMSRECEAAGCSKQPHYGPEGGKMRWCAGQAWEGARGSVP